MSVPPNPASRRRAHARWSLRLVVLVLGALSLPMPASAANRGLLPLHPRVADTQLLVPERRAMASPAPPLVEPSALPDGLLTVEPEAPEVVRASVPAAPASAAVLAQAPASGLVTAPIQGPTQGSTQGPTQGPTQAPAQAPAQASAQAPAQAPAPATAPATALAPEEGALPFDSLVRHAAEAASVDAALLHAIIDVESGYDPQALSGRGAIGLMQVLPRTGERFGVRRLEDPAENVRAGASYLRWLLTRFDDDLPLVLAAYNAGEGAVLRYGRQIPPFPETRNYVRKVMAGYARLRATPAPEAVAGRRHAGTPDKSAPRPAPRDIVTSAREPLPAPTAARAAPPENEVPADPAWRLLRGLGTLLTRSPSVEAAGGRGRDQPAVLMPSGGRGRSVGPAGG
ncbi:lytic transglycosylase domain-containing protein [Pandoraea bronchicola]|uniref:Peptidoglycan N-acetylmuramoylhydrolase n=1 Tax=Pandoraea bronchicola TaxID=2508287 RepID=A0A5E5BXX0_9BURK|nr:lytic transglycosylase domain-containing protein [Pandoraea bronchicola]VVE90649.1 peptidoglycan N-acetylmuramoylhydrolase [Pandoraea bronchicola]